MKKFLKTVLPLLLVLVMSLALVACNKDDNAGKNDKPDTDVDNQGADKADLEDELIIYSTHPEDMLEVVADKFTEKYGVEVQFINLKGELAERVRSEKDNPQADIMYGGAVSLFASLDEDGVFEKVDVSYAGDLTDNLKSANGTWYATLQTPVVFFYNSDRVTEAEAPKSWAELVDPKYEGMICSRDGLSSSQRATVAALLYNYDKEGKIDEGWEYLKKLDANTKSYYNSGSQHFQAVGMGEAPISYGVQSAIIQNRDNNDLPLAMLIPEEGAVMIPDAVGAIKNAPHPKAAAAFVEFAGSVEVQTMLANQFQRVPTLEEAMKAGPDFMKDGIKGMDTDWAEISKHEAEWIQKWEDEIRSKGKDVAKE